MAVGAEARSAGSLARQLPGASVAGSSWVGLLAGLLGEGSAQRLGLELVHYKGSGFRRIPGLRARFCLGLEWVVHVCGGNTSVCIEIQRHDKRTPAMLC